VVVYSVLFIRIFIQFILYFIPSDPVLFVLRNSHYFIYEYSMDKYAFLWFIRYVVVYKVDLSIRLISPITWNLETTTIWYDVDEKTNRKVRKTVILTGDMENILLDLWERGVFYINPFIRTSDLAKNVNRIVLASLQ